MNLTYKWFWNLAMWRNIYKVLHEAQQVTQSENSWIVPIQRFLRYCITKTACYGCQKTLQALQSEGEKRCGDSSRHLCIHILIMAIKGSLWKLAEKFGVCKTSQNLGEPYRLVVHDISFLLDKSAKCLPRQSQWMIAPVL